jgi:coenzyme F420-reducing hydrogenase delta subunit
MEYILTAFAAKVEGVLVMACHEGNCHSEKGTGLARNRTKQIVRFLENTSASPKRLKIHTMAANMGKDFSDTTNRWQKQIAAMGPLHTSASGQVMSPIKDTQ